MFNLPTVLQNRDKFYGLADNAFLSLFRFGSGLAIARLAGAEVFAAYILLVTTSVIFQILPSTSYLIPLLNRGTGAAPQEYAALCTWAQRGVERATLGFLLIGSLTLLCLPNLPVDLPTGSAFLATACCQLWQHTKRTRLQMEFKQAHALLADLLASGLHLGLSAWLWHRGLPLHTAFWCGAAAGAILGGSLMARHMRRLKLDADADTQPLIDSAQSKGRAMLRGSIANTACSRLQPYLLAWIASPEMLAFYGVLWTLIGPVRLLSMALTNLLRPRLALYQNQQQPAQFKRTYNLALVILIGGGAAATLGAGILGDWAISLLFGAELGPASRWLSLALVYATLDATTTCQMIALQIRRDDGAALTARLRIHAAIISLALVVPATLYLGLTGTIGSLLLAELYYAIACSRIKRAAK